MSQPARVDSDITIVGIPGSLREGSFTRLAVQIALRGAAEVGAKTQLLDLREYNLVDCTGKQNRAGGSNDLDRLKAAVQKAQGVILGTPEYHGSFSGVLKNALDLMGFSEFEGKMIGLVGVSAGSMGAFNALLALQPVGRALHAWVVPELAAVPFGSKAFDAEGNLKDPALEQRVKTVGRQVARFAYLHSSAQVRDFVQQWEDAPRNPGGETQVDPALFHIE